MVLEWLLSSLFILGALVLAGLPVALGCCRLRTLLCGTTVLAAIAALLWLSSFVAGVRHRSETAAAQPVRTRDDGLFAGSKACRECHPGQHESWHRTYHRTMTQVAGPESVLAPFDGRELKSYGMTVRVERRGDEFWVEIADPEWVLNRVMREIDPSAGEAPRVEKRIVMTTGSHHFQVYWYAADETGELWQFPWRYHIGEARWMHQDDVFLHSPPRMPGLGHRVWNGSCIECHSVAGQPGKNLETQRFEETRVAELGIACEACHGPGAAHVRGQRDGRIHDSPMVHPKSCSPELSVQICGSCHGHFEYTDPNAVLRRQFAGREFRPGEDFTREARFLSVADETVVRDGPDVLSISRFWADGACRSGGREYNGLVDSACHVQGRLTCLECHSMHDSDPDDQLAARMETNDACYQCHESYRDRLVEHTHHPAGSSGSLCYNCHMPYTSYALLKAIRSHRIDSPRVVGLRSNARLNACNLCHLDQSLTWTADRLAEWYGVDSPELTDEEREIPASALWLLKGDAGQRAIAACAMGWSAAQEVSGGDWTVPLLAQALEDEYSAVRFNAFQSVRSTPGFAGVQKVFDSPPRQRSAAKEELLRQWQATPRAFDQMRPEPLFDAGRPNWEIIEDLVRKKDERGLVVIE